MTSMKKIFILLFILCSLQGRDLFSAEKTQDRGKKYLDLIVLLDPIGEELPAKPGKPLTYSAAVALSQKTAPILTSINVLENCCIWLEQHAKMLGEVKQAVAADYTTALKKAEQLCGSAFHPWTAIVLCLVDFKDWDCFIHTDYNLVLCVPKNYMKRYGAGISPLKDCGFNTEVFEKIQNPSSKVIVDKIDAVKSMGKFDAADIVASLMSSFIPQKKLLRTGATNTSDAIQMWNIFISGHGGQGTSKKGLIDRINNNSAQLALIEEQLASIPLVPATQAMYKMIEKAIGLSKKAVDQDRNLLVSAENLDDNAAVPGTAQIAGVPFGQFSTFLKFLENDINTSFLYYASCFAGGQNQTFVNDVLSQEEASFIVSSVGVGDVEVYGYDLEFKPSKNNSTLIMSSIDFVTFFELLNAYFGNTTEFIAKQKSQKDPIASILRSVVPRQLLEINQPTIRIPHIGVFTPISVDKSVKILTNVMAKSYTFENKMIEFVDPEIKAVMIYPAFIEVPVKIKPIIKIISPSQEVNVKEQKAIHVFNKVLSDTSFRQVVLNFVSGNFSVNKTVFNIKELESANYQDSGFANNKDQRLILKNVTITIEGTPATIINVAFMHNDKKYGYTFQISNLKDKQELLNTVFKGITASKSINNYDDIAQDVEEMDTTFEVQQPGSMKKILFMKKLDGLEVALDPEQIEQEKAWLAKNNKPATTFANALNRHKVELSGIIDQINKLTAMELSPKDRQELLQKTDAIDARINQELAVLTMVKPAPITPSSPPIALAEQQAAMLREQLEKLTPAERDVLEQILRDKIAALEQQAAPAVVKPVVVQPKITNPYTRPARTKPVYQPKPVYDKSTTRRPEAIKPSTQYRPRTEKGRVAPASREKVAPAKYKKRAPVK